MTLATTDPMRPHLYAIRQMRSETDDTFTMELVPANGSALAPFGAGQFNMVYVPGVGEIPISISGDPSVPSRLLHTTRAVGGVTDAMRALRRGDVLGVRGPFGVGWPIPEAAGQDVVLVAGGIGLAPLRPVIYALLAERERYGKIVLLYGTRTPADILFARELRRWRGSLSFDVHVTVDERRRHVLSIQIDRTGGILVVANTGHDSVTDGEVETLDLARGDIDHPCVAQQ